MKKNILYILLIFLFTIFIHAQQSIDASKAAITLWSTHLVPSFLIPFILVRILSKYEVITPILKPLTPMINKLFNIDIHVFESIVYALLLGFPSSTIFLSNLYPKLTRSAYNRLIGCVFMCSPTFILLSLKSIYGTHTASLLLCQITSVFLLLFASRKYKILSTQTKQHMSMKIALQEAIEQSIQVLLFILVYICMSFIVIQILSLYVSEQIKIPLSLLIEFSSGIFHLQELHLPQSMNLLICTLILSYGGLCVHMQIITSAQNTFKYSTFLKYRIMHLMFASILVYLMCCR